MKNRKLLVDTLKKKDTHEYNKAVSIPRLSSISGLMSLFGLTSNIRINVPLRNCYFCLISLSIKYLFYF